MIVTPMVPDMADEFMARVNKVWTEKGYSVEDIPKWLPAVRWHEAQSMLPLDKQELLDVQPSTAQRKVDWLDIIVLPGAWTTIPNDELNPRLPHDDPTFIGNIATDALIFNQQNGLFEPPTSAQ